MSDDTADGDGDARGEEHDETHARAADDTHGGAADGGRPLAGRVAVITGASAGIGAATARRLAGDGAAVVLAARRGERLRELAADIEREHGVAARAVPTDVTDSDAVAALAETTVEREGRIDVAVANAGIGEERDVPVDELPLEQFRAVTRTNVDGAFHTARAVLPHLRETEGTLVFVGSFKGTYPSSSTPVYAATKWWLRGFARSVAAQAGADGVGVTTVNPTGVRTEFGERFRGTTNEEALEEGTLDAGTVAETVAFAARQSPPATLAEVDLYRRDVLGRF